MNDPSAEVQRLRRQLVDARRAAARTQQEAVEHLALSWEVDDPRWAAYLERLTQTEQRAEQAEEERDALREVLRMMAVTLEVMARQREEWRHRARGEVQPPGEWRRTSGEER